MTQTRPKISDHNINTGKVTVREMNDEELAQYEIDQVTMREFIQKQESKIAAKQSAIDKLATLGLTEDEAKALFS